MIGHYAPRNYFVLFAIIIKKRIFNNLCNAVITHKALPHSRILVFIYHNKFFSHLGFVGVRASSPLHINFGRSIGAWASSPQILQAGSLRSNRGILSIWQAGSLHSIRGILIVWRAGSPHSNTNLAFPLLYYIVRYGVVEAVRYHLITLVFNVRQVFAAVIMDFFVGHTNVDLSCRCLCLHRLS